MRVNALGELQCVAVDNVLVGWRDGQDDALGRCDVVEHHAAYARLYVRRLVAHWELGDAGEVHQRHGAVRGGGSGGAGASDEGGKR